MWTILGTVIGFTVFALYAGLFEYVFHRWVLHRPSCALAFPYRMHTAVHHHVFGAGKTYQVQRPEDHGLILFEWWQPVLLLAGHAPLAWGLQVATGLWSSEEQWRRSPGTTGSTSTGTGACITPEAG
jgi:hypothetical protein